MKFIKTQLSEKVVEKSRNFKDPHIVKKKWGTIEADLKLNVAKGFDSTTSAMNVLARMEILDDEKRKNGIDDYLASFKALVSSLDTFLREYTKNQKRKCTAGNYSYNLLDQAELTLNLCWILRNPIIHNGNIIDEKCKRDYEKIFNNGKINNVFPLIDLPEYLPLGQEFCISWDQYQRLKIIYFEFLSKKCSPEVVDILWHRACVNCEGLTDIILGVTYNGYDIRLSLNDLHSIGKDPMVVKKGFALQECTISPKEKRAFFNDGTSIPADIRKR